MNEKGFIWALFPLIISALVPVLAVLVGIPLLSIFFGTAITGILKFLVIAGIGVVLFALPGYVKVPKQLGFPLALAGLAFLFVGLAVFMGALPESVFRFEDTLQSDNWTGATSSSGLDVKCLPGQYSETFTSEKTARWEVFKILSTPGIIGDVSLSISENGKSVFSSNQRFSTIGGTAFNLTGAGQVSVSKLVFDFQGRADSDFTDNEFQVPVPADVFLCQGRSYTVTVNGSVPICWTDGGGGFKRFLWNSFVTPDATAATNYCAGSLNLSPPAPQPTPINPVPLPGLPGVTPPVPQPPVSVPAPIPAISPSLLPVVGALAVGGVLAYFLIGRR